MNMIKRTLLKCWFVPSRRVDVYQRIENSLHDGMSFHSALGRLIHEYSLKNDPRAVILKSWREEFSKSGSLQTVLEGWVPPSEIMLLEAGRQSGDLKSGLSEANTLVLSLDNARRLVFKGMLLPVSLIGAVFVLGLFVIL